MFRFTIRELFWLTVVVALALAWCVNHRQLATERAFHSSLTKLDGPVYLNPDRNGKSRLFGPVYVQLLEY